MLYLHIFLYYIHFKMAASKVNLLFCQKPNAVEGEWGGDVKHDSALERLWNGGAVLWGDVKCVLILTGQWTVM